METKPQSNTGVILCTYDDEINEEVISFYSDAPQKTIDALAFNGEWYVVKQILLDWGYKVIEPAIIN